MSFRCNKCKEPQPIGHAPINIVTKTRDKNYPDTSKVGKEIVQEMSCCPPCSEVILLAQRELRLSQEKTLAKALEIQSRSFDNTPKFGERPSEWS